MYDPEACSGYGQCVGAAPELFRFAADGSLILLNPNPGEELREMAQDAVDLCPTHALSLVED